MILVETHCKIYEKKIYNTGNADQVIFLGSYHTCLTLREGSIFSQRMDGQNKYLTLLDPASEISG